ncbi:hypothetical protein RND71_004457 [Anisodus tanguticus]|uniref:Uncharacterized protein n=1 Tax=Anisodus tanguticus TaxID=243964 RepID=A0AAE1VUT2_9SOLA|nr:hypothetical protein RND71_004457 [Anisodus tanguticus]
MGLGVFGTTYADPKGPPAWRFHPLYRVDMPLPRLSTSVTAQSLYGPSWINSIGSRMWPSNEFYFVDKLFPELDEDDLRSFQQRQRQRQRRYDGHKI